MLVKMSRLLRERFDADAVVKRTTQSRDLRNSFGTLGARRRKDHYALSLSPGFLLALKAEFVPGRPRGRFAGETTRPK